MVAYTMIHTGIGSVLWRPKPETVLSRDLRQSGGRYFDGTFNVFDHDELNESASWNDDDVSVVTMPNFSLWVQRC